MTLEEIRKEEFIDIGVLYSKILCAIEKLENDKQKIEYAVDFADAVESFIANYQIRRYKHKYLELLANELATKKVESIDDPKPSLFVTEMEQRYGEDWELILIEQEETLKKSAVSELLKEKGS